MQLIAAVENRVMPSLQFTCSRSPDEYVVHYLATPGESLDDQVGVPTPLVRGTRKAHGYMQIPAPAGREDEGSELRGLLVQGNLKVAMGGVKLGQTGSRCQDSLENVRN